MQKLLRRKHSGRFESLPGRTHSDDFLNLPRSGYPTGLHRAPALNDIDQDHDDGRSKALDVVNLPSSFWFTLFF